MRRCAISISTASADLVAQGVIEILESIGVDDDEPHRAAEMYGFREMIRQFLIETLAIADARESVRRGLNRELRVRFTKRLRLPLGAELVLEGDLLRLGENLVHVHAASDGDIEQRSEFPRVGFDFAQSFEDLRTVED